MNRQVAPNILQAQVGIGNRPLNKANRQALSAFSSNLQAAVGKPSMSTTQLQPPAKRKGLSCLNVASRNNVANIAASNKPQLYKGPQKVDSNKENVGIGLKATSRLGAPTKHFANPFHNRAAAVVPAFAVEKPRLPLAFTIHCDEIDKENTATRRSPPKIAETVLQATEAFYLHSPHKPFSFDIEQDREEEEIVVVDSPMIVDNSLECLSLKDEKQLPEENTIPEYTNEIYTYLREAETKYRAKANYMRKQGDITSGMRRILVDWLVEVCQEYKLNEETLYLAVSYIDRFLSCMAVVRGKLQLVGAACMFIASKYEEIFPPDVGEFVYITDDTYNKVQVLKMEQLILKVLAFHLAAPTSNFFLQRVCTLCKVSSVTEALAKYLCELTLLEAEPFLRFLPSEIACSALALANYTLGQELWDSKNQAISGYKEEEFRECLECLYNFYLEVAVCPQQAIQEKYRAIRFHCVSAFSPPPSLPPNSNH